ncbi:hypothetical protein BASA61_001438 [Batrachochytrium salamandrivorans]|nr:hypothetical protein BASA61_001438 [Batrachochytrium salamandrivorans]
MSTFASSKRTLFQTGEDTPAPNAYAVDQTLLNNDSYKQFGFLEKSQRFQSQASKDRQPANADGLVSSEGNVLSRSPSPPVPPRIVRNDKEEINKLKRELSRQSTTIERHQIKYEREAHTLHERLQKTESQLQLAIKEKATLLSQSMLKEKTLHDLQQQHLVLKNHAEKLEKSNTGLYEKTLQVGPLRKKVEDLEKLTTRTKTHIDRKMAHENETLVMQMQKMKTDLDTVVGQKESLSSSVHSLKTETRDQRESIASLNLLLTSAKENYDTAQKRWRDERAEYEKRTTLLSDQLEAEKADFSDIVKTLKASEAAAREAAHAAKSSAEHQRSAYLQRIAQLEGDLDIVERAVVDKTKHNEALVEKSRSTQEALQQQLAELSIKADRADGMAQLEYEIQQLRSTYQRDTTHLENAVADAVTGRDDERQRLERKISTLSQQIVHLEGERREASHSYTLSLEAKTALVSAKDAELKELNKLVESTKAHAEEIQFSNDDLTQTIAKLHVQIQSQSSASDASQQSLLGKLRDSQSDAELLHRQIDDLKRRHAEAVEQSRAETVNALQHCEHLSTQMSDAQRDYSTERKQFQHDIANLESQIDDLQHQLSVATRQAALVSHERDLEVGALKSRAKELEAAMTAVTADANSKEVLYTKSRADLDHELAALRSRLDVETSRYQQRIDALDADLERTLSHLRELEDDNARLGRTCTQLEAFGKTEQAEFHLRLDAMSNQLAERANEMAAVTAVVAKLEEDKVVLIKQADAARVALSADSECLSKQIADLEGQLETATVELQSATTTVGQLESIVADGNNALLALREELKLSEEAVSDLQKKHVEATTQAASLAETLSKAQSDHASEMEMACNLRNELQRDLAASVSHSEVLQFEVLVAGQTQQQQESDLACLRQKLDLEAKQADAQQLLLDTTRTRLETCIRESSDLQGRIATMVSEKLLLVATHQAEMDSARTAHSNAISEMEARLTKISAASEDLRDRLAERDGEILTLRSSRVQSESEQQSLVRDLDMTRQNLQENIASLTVAQQSLLEIRKDLDVEKSSHSSALSELALSRTEFSAATSRVEDLQMKLDQIHLKYTALVGDADALRADVRSRDKQIAEMTATSVGTDARLSESHQQIATLEANCSALSEQLDRALMLKTEFFATETLLNRRIKDELQPRVQQLEADLAKKEAGLVDAVQKSEENRSAARLEVNLLEKKLQDLSAERERLDGVCRSLNKVIAESETTVVAFRDQIDQLRQAQTASHEERTHMLLTQQQQHQQQQQRDAAHALVLSELESKLQTASMDADKYRSSHDALKASMDQQSAVSTSKLAETSSKLSAVEAQRTELEVTLGAFKASLQIAQADANHCRAELSEARQAAARTSAEHSQSMEDMRSKNAAQANTIKFHTSERERVDADMARLRADHKVQLADLVSSIATLESNLASTSKAHEQLQIQSTRLEGRLASESKHFEAGVQDLTLKLAAKTSKIKDMDMQIVTLIDQLQLVQLRHSNDIDSRDFEIKKCRSQLDTVESAHAKLLEKHRELTQSTLVSGQKEKDLKAVLDQKQALDAKLADVEAKARIDRDVLNVKVEESIALVAEHEERCIQMRILLEDAERTKTEMQASFDASLKMLQVRGQLNEAESKKISELNAELFGHANSRQKIKHVSQLKAENMKLKTTSAKIEQERIQLRQRVVSLERELDASRPISGVGGIMLSKRITVGRRQPFGGGLEGSYGGAGSGVGQTGGSTYSVGASSVRHLNGGDRDPVVGGMVGHGDNATAGEDSVLDESITRTTIAEKESHGMGGVSFFIS